MNATSQYQMTIVIPVYNEEDNMPAIEARLSAYLTKALCKTCVLFVDDGSADNSLECIKGICSRHNDFFYISFVKNAGLSAAMKAGIDTTCSAYVGYIDADLQTDPDDFNLLLSDIEEYEMVMGVRANRKDTAFKRLQSRIANGFRRMVTHDGVADTGCPLKVIHTANAKRIPFFTGMHRFLPALLMLQGARFKQVPVRHYPRTAGVSKFSMWNRVFVGFVDCFAFLYIKRRYIDYHIASGNVD